jgi:hypothetical protein
MQILDYNLICTCQCCPEQYDVLDSEGKQSGYIRLRGGNFKAYYPDVGEELVFYHCFEGDQFKGMFDNDEEREFFLTEAVKALHNKIKLERSKHESNQNLSPTSLPTYRD